MFLNTSSLLEINKTLTLVDLQKKLNAVEKKKGRKAITAHRKRRRRDTGGELSAKEIRARKIQEGTGSSTPSKAPTGAPTGKFELTGNAAAVHDLSNPYKKTKKPKGKERTPVKQQSDKPLRQSARKRMTKLALQALRNRDGSYKKETVREPINTDSTRQLTAAQRQAHASHAASSYLREGKDLSGVSLNTSVPPQGKGKKYGATGKSKKGKGGKVRNEPSRVNARAKPHQPAKNSKQIARDIRDITAGRVPKRIQDKMDKKFKPKKPRTWKRGQQGKIERGDGNVPASAGQTSNISSKKVRGSTTTTGGNQFRGFLGRKDAANDLIEQVNDLKKVYLSEFKPRKTDPAMQPDKIRQNQGVGSKEAPNKVGAPNPVKINEIVENYKRRQSGKGRPKQGIINRKDLDSYWKKQGYKDSKDPELEETERGSVRTYSTPPPSKGSASRIIGRKLGEGSQAGQQEISSDKPSKVNQIAVDAARRNAAKRKERQQAQGKTDRKRRGVNAESSSEESKRLKEEFEKHKLDSAAGHSGAMGVKQNTKKRGRKRKETLPKKRKVPLGALGKTYKGSISNNNMVLSLDEIRGIYKGLAVRKTEGDQTAEGQATQARAQSGVKTQIRTRKNPDKIRDKITEVKTPKSSAIHSNRLGFASDLRRHAKSIENLEDNIGLMATLYKAHYEAGII